MAATPPGASCSHDEVVTLLAPTAPLRWQYVDVRTPEEFASGHIEGSYNLPFQLGDLAGLHPNPDFLPLTQATFGREAPLILGCRSGARAASAERILRDAGYTTLRVHLGSLVGARDAFGRPGVGWLQLGKPVTTTAVPGRTHAELLAAWRKATPAEPGPTLEP